MVAEVADHLAVPRPRVLGVGRGVDADEAAAGADVVLEGVLLLGGKDVAGGGEEDDGVEQGEVGGVELGGVLGGNDAEVVGRAERLDRRDALVDRVMPEPGRLREHEHVLERVGARVLDGDRTRHLGVDVADERVDPGSVERVVDGSWPVPTVDWRGGFQLALVPWTLCGNVSPANVQRTVSPVVTVTFGGTHDALGIDRGGWSLGPATLAVNRPVNSAAGTTTPRTPSDA